jgi:esterase/lipase
MASDVSVLAAPVSRPTTSYAEAMERARAFMALDDDSILPQARTALVADGKPSGDAVVLFHGFTNHPGQFAEFVPMLRARGANIFVPRLPGHGDRNRMTTRLASVTAEELLASATEAVDIACGLGERVSVLGISTGALLCAYFAQYRDDVWCAVPVSPAFALLQLPHDVSRLLAAVVRILPNMFLWWDPRLKTRQRPRTAYPRFPTHALMQALRIGDDVYTAAQRDPARAKHITTIVNRADPAVNNDVTADVVHEWRGLRREGVIYSELRNLPENHDIVDPDNALARTDLVYPVLLDALSLANVEH